MESPISWAAPHAFALAGDLDADAPRYRLKPLSAAAFELFSEYWQMWRRWEDAFHRGSVNVAIPPVLAEHDRIHIGVGFSVDRPGIEAALPVKLGLKLQRNDFIGFTDGRLGACDRGR